MCKELKEDRERIKNLIEDRLIEAKAKNVIRIGPERLKHLIDCICFNIDNPNYIRKEE